MFIRIFGSISQGLSTAASSGYETYTKTKNSTAAILVASFAFLADSFSTFNFQGSALHRLQNPPKIPEAPNLAEEEAGDDQGHADRADRVAFAEEKGFSSSPSTLASLFPVHKSSFSKAVHSSYGLTHSQKAALLLSPSCSKNIEEAEGSVSYDQPSISESKTVRGRTFNPSIDTDLGPIASKSSSWSVTKQLLYLSLDSGKNFSNRFFLLNNLWLLFGMDSSTLAFKITLGTVFTIKQVFSMSNETYENVAKISGKKRPFYHRMFKVLPSFASKQVFRLAGTLEHTFLDSILPWLLLIPKSSIDYLNTHKTERDIALGCAIPVATFITLIAFAQAFLFEGRHTLKNLKKGREKIPSTELTLLNDPLLATLHFTTWLMGPFHGAGTLANVYVSLDNLLEEQYRWAAIVSSVLCGLFYARLVHLSEVGEVREQIEGEYLRRTEITEAADGEDLPESHKHQNIHPLLH